jgi:hypothetical protein
LAEELGEPTSLEDFERKAQPLSYASDNYVSVVPASGGASASKCPGRPAA